MEQISNNQLIENYLLEFETNSLKDAIGKITQDRVLDLKVIRDRSIVKDYQVARRDTEKSVQEINDDLAYKYNLSFPAIRAIVLAGTKCKV